MKKILFSFMAIAVIGISSPVYAQQQINNDGASANELQPQAQGVQRNAGSAQYKSEDINREVGNSDVLKNTQVDQLVVVGAPSSSTTPEPSRGLVSWLVFGSGILLILLAPALLYVRDTKRKGSYAPVNSNEALSDNMDASSETEAKTDTEEVEVTNDEPTLEKESEEAEVTEHDAKQEDTKKKKKSKNKSKKKSKRNKKK